MSNKKQHDKPSEIPSKKYSEVNPPADPEEPIVPSENDPDIVPDEENESPPYDEPAPPGEGP